jgi:hypothetical protein
LKKTGSFAIVRPTSANPLNMIIKIPKNSAPIYILPFVIESRCILVRKKTVIAIIAMSVNWKVRRITKYEIVYLYYTFPNKSKEIIKTLRFLKVLLI